MDWQLAIEALAGNNQEMRAQYREIARWFPSLEMMRNHARGLVKVMTAAEKQRAFPAGRTIPPPTILLWAMREVQRSPDPRQRARWWMYRSSTTPPAAADHVTDAVLALPAPINNAYWERRNPWVLGPSDDSDGESSDDESSDDESSDEPSDDSDDEVDEVVVLSDDEPELQLLAPVLDAVEGDRNLPIHVDALPEVADLPDGVVVKQEQDGGEEDVVEPAPGKKKRAAVTAVRRSQRLKMLKKEE